MHTCTPYANALRRVLTALVFCGTLAVAGCDGSDSSSKNNNSPSPSGVDPRSGNDSNVTVFNRSQTFSLEAYIDGYRLGTVPANSYRSWKVASGQYFVQANMANGSQPVINVNIQPAEDEYVFVYDSGSPQIRLTPR